MRTTIQYLLLVILFGLSVTVRLKNISNTIDNNNQCHVFLLSPIEIWQKKAPANYHFAPVQTFENTGDKFNNFYKRLEDKTGNNYYVSYPPFTFVMGYYFFKLTGLAPGQLALQYLNLLLHFISGLLIYFICNLLLKKPLWSFNRASLIAYTAYLFIPANLYLHTEIFFPEMLGQVMMLVSVFFYLQYKQHHTTTYLFLLVLSIFIGIYTEWLCWILSIVLLITALKNKEKKLRNVILLSASIGLLLFIIQYASIAGVTPFVKSMLVRFQERTGYLNSNNQLSDLLSGFLLNLNHAMFPFGYLALIFFFILKRQKNSFHIDHTLKIVLWPVIIYALLFFNFTGTHYHSLAKLSIFIALILGITLHAITELFPNKKNIFLLLTLGLCSLSWIHFKGSIEYEPLNNKLINAGIYISKKSMPEETIFIITDADIAYPEHFLSYISKRNIVQVTSKKEAIEKHLLPYHKNKLVIYKFDEQFKLLEEVHEDI